MSAIFAFVAALVLLAIGLRLSAFFSGTEIGFYRVSTLRVAIDAQAGDARAKWLMWFAAHPAFFVATTLVGNNIANYVSTLSIGLGGAAIIASDSVWVEIIGTLFLTPIVFIFGELVPKNLYYRAPMRFLRREIPFFVTCYRAFLPATLPLVGLTKLIQRFGSTEERIVESALGRSRLAQVLSQGHEEGLLSEIQNRMVTGLMQTAMQPVTASMTPAQRVLGLEDKATRDEIVQHARSYGMTAVPIRREATDSWYGYVRVVDLVVLRRSPKAVIEEMTSIDSRLSKLEALVLLRDAGSAYGRVIDGDRTLGVVSTRGLVEQLFRPPQAAGIAPPR